MAMDLTATIDRMIEETLMGHAQKAEQLTRVQLVLQIPRELAAKQAAQSLDLDKLIESLDKQIGEQRELIAGLVSSAAPAYELAEAEDRLTLLMQRRSSKMRIVSQLDESAELIIQQVNTIIKAAA